MKTIEDKIQKVRFERKELKQRMQVIIDRLNLLNEKLDNKMFTIKLKLKHLDNLGYAFGLDGDVYFDLALEQITIRGFKFKTIEEYEDYLIEMYA